MNDLLKGQIVLDHRGCDCLDALLNYSLHFSCLYGQFSVIFTW